MEINQIQNADCLAKLKELPDNSIDLMFCDPPYALGSDVIILANGKPEYQKTRDFMDKWNQPNGAFWEEWFKEANRVLKYGGHCLMFGLDRQLMLYKYYACFAGFTEKQSLYWYFISNFPKASDLSKNIDKHFGEERESMPNPKAKQQTGSNKDTLALNAKKGVEFIQPNAKNIIAQKYNGMKYSVAPLKQTNETIMVFQKPYKTGSCLHNTLAMENGDSEITCGALDIEGNRVGTECIKGGNGELGKKRYGFLERKKETDTTHEGRFPSQTFCDDETASILDGQSGVSKGDNRKYIKGSVKDSNIFKGVNKGKDTPCYSDTAGCSKILHKCNYENNDYDIYNYCAKVSKKERGEGNNHPTVKPISLLRKILSYFKTPNKQIVLDCFMGSGSMQIACIKENMNYIGYELDEEYFKIAEQRINHTLQKKQEQLF